MRYPQCHLCHPGHQVCHSRAREVAAALHSPQGYPGPVAPVELTDLGGGWFEAGIDGEARLGWNHNLDDVAAFARDSVLGEVLFLPEFSALVCVRGQFDTTASQCRLLYPAWGGRHGCVAGGTTR